jgi:hypothetical protein
MMSVIPLFLTAPAPPTCAALFFSPLSDSPRCRFLLRRLHGLGSNCGSRARWRLSPSASGHGHTGVGSLVHTKSQPGCAGIFGRWLSNIANSFACLQPFWQIETELLHLHTPTRGIRRAGVAALVSVHGANRCSSYATCCNGNYSANC